MSSLLSVGDNNGTGQRFIIIATPQGPNAEGGPSATPANGPTTDNYLHTNYYPNTAAPGQTDECEAANEPYAVGKQVIGNVPGNQGTAHDITKARPSNGAPQPGYRPQTRPAQGPHGRRAVPGRCDRAGHRGIATYLGFTKDIPFTHDFRVKAVFTQANSIRKNSPVRIAGVNVGKVKKIEREPGTTAAIVTMEIQDKGLPIHTDATMKIRPRIFLEGNFFVDVKPGTPSAPHARRQRHDPDHADRDAGPARPGADLAAGGLARRPEGRAEGLRRRR